MKNKIYILIIISAFFITSCHNIDYNKKLNNGTLNITDLASIKPILLIGQWYFAPNKILDPKDFFTYDSLIITDKLVWDGKPYPKYGYGTYGCQIIAPRGNYGLKILRIQAASRIFVNNKLVYSAGRVANRRNSEIPKIYPKIVPIISHNDTIKIVIQISNYHFRIGALQDKLLFGKYDTLIKESWATFAPQFIILGFIFISVFFNFWLFFFRRKELSALFFTLSLVAQFIYELSNNEISLLYFFPNISYYWLVAIDFSSNYLRFLFLILFLYESFKNDFPKLFKYVGYLGALFWLTVLILPIYIYTQFLFIFIAIVYLAMLWSTILLLVRLLQTKDSLYLFGAIGSISIIFIAVFETLYIKGISQTFNFAFIGVILFVLNFTYLNSRKIARLEEYALSLSKNIETVNKMRSKLLQIPAYDIKSVISIIFSEINAVYIRLCDYKTKNLIAQQGDPNYFSQKIINKAIRNKKQKFFKHPINKNYVIVSSINVEDKTYLLYVAGRYKRYDIEIINLLENQIRIFIDNYNFYQELQNLKENLENIVQERKKLSLQQKNELIQKTVELDERLEEININITVINELNKQLIEEQQKIEQTKKILLSQKKEIEKQRDKIFAINEQLGASIRYAKKISEALFKPYHKLDKKFFEFNLPKAKSSGDFWWTEKQDNKRIIIVGDCIGYGVTGVFYTVLLQELIKNAILTLRNTEFKAHHLLQEIYRLFKNKLKQEALYDAPMLTAIIWDDENNFQFSAFGQDAIIIQQADQIVLQGTSAIPGLDLPDEKQLKTTIIKLKPQERVYIFTDGYYKQLSDKGKFGKKRFKELISKIWRLPLNSQKIMLFEYLENWKDKHKQTDDILILGIIVD